jgi:uncharacterized protein YifE (UPF0438 family)
MDKPRALTPEEVKLLSSHLWFYEELDRGTRKPTTPAQDHFVMVCRKQAAPQTEHEIAYVKYLGIVSAADDTYRECCKDMKMSDDDRWW